MSIRNSEARRGAYGMNDDLAACIARAIFAGRQAEGHPQRDWERLSPPVRFNFEVEGEYIAKAIRAEFDVTGRR